MSEFAPKVPKTPRGEVNKTLQELRQGNVPEHIPQTDRIKAEIYGITAYFVEKIATECKQWIAAHPGRAFSFAVFDESVNQQESHSYEIDEKLLIGSSDLDDVLFGISQAIEGLAHIAISEHIYPSINASGVVQQTEHDSMALKRLETLLYEYPRREQGNVESFLITAAIPPALFIPLILRAGLHKYKAAFGAYPVPGSVAFVDLEKQLMKIVLKLTQINILELKDAVGGLARVQKNGQPDFSDNFDTLISFTKTETGFVISADMITDYTPNKKLEGVVNPTLGCPAIYAKVESQNAIRFFMDYAVDLLARSGVYTNT